MLKKTFVVDNKSVLNNFGIQNGSYTLVYNFFKTIIGSNSDPKLYITDISNSRTEIRIRPILGACTAEDWDRLATLDVKNITYKINFSNNITNLITNLVFDPEGSIRTYDELIAKRKGSVILKLYEPLDSNITDRTRF